MSSDSGSPPQLVFIPREVWKGGFQEIGCVHFQELLVGHRRVPDSRRIEQGCGDLARHDQLKHSGQDDTLLLEPCKGNY